MQVAKWGNSLAVRLPAAVVEALELKEGDQILVKVLAIEGNKIRLSRKAVLKEQREKLKSGKA